MSRSAATTFLFVALACAFGGPSARAQPAPPANSSWEINLHAAGMHTALFDEAGQGFQFGGRVLRNFGNGLSFGASLDRATASGVQVAPFSDLDASLLLYSAGLEYRFRVSPRASLFLVAGAGAATLSFDAAPSGVRQSSTGLLIPVGGGFKIYGRSEAPSWALRFDFRDNVVLLDTPTSGGEVTTEPRNNFEVSAGFSFLVGSDPPARPGDPRREARQPRAARERPRPAPAGPAERVEDREAAAEEAERGAVEEAVPAAPTDADGDGVPDDGDACPGTPSGIPVDATGCLDRPPAAEIPEDFEPVAEAAPVPTPETPDEVAGPAVEDEDGDGVSDDRDACPGTPRGIPVDTEGCLARVETAEDPAEPAEDRPPVDRPLPDAADTARCLESQEWYVEGEIVEYDGRPFEVVGSPKAVDRSFLVEVGSYRNVPILVSDTARPPFRDFWMPVCGVEDRFELYVEGNSLPWNP